MVDLELGLADFVVVDLVDVRNYLHSMGASQDFVVDQPTEVAESLDYSKPVVLEEMLDQMAVETQVLAHGMPANKKISLFGYYCKKGIINYIRLLVEAY